MTYGPPSEESSPAPRIGYNHPAYQGRPPSSPRKPKQHRTCAKVVLAFITISPVFIFGGIIYSATSGDTTAYVHPAVGSFQFKVTEAVSAKYPEITVREIECPAESNPEVQYEDGNNLELEQGDVVVCTAVDNTPLYEEDYSFYDLEVTVGNVERGSRYNTNPGYDITVEVSEVK